MSEIIEHYSDQHAAAQHGLVGDDIDWLVKQRHQAINTFRTLGFPDTSVENWRYTSLKSITSKYFEVSVDASQQNISVDQFWTPSLQCYRMAFVDGHFSPKESILPQGIEGVHIAPLSQASSNQSAMASMHQEGQLDFEDGLAALNVAFSTDGYLIRIDDSVELDKPIEILFVSASDNRASLPRNNISLGINANATVIEKHVSLGEEKKLNNATGTISLDNGANLDYFLIQTPNIDLSLVSTIEARLGRASQFSSYTITLGGSLVRNNLKIVLDGEGAHCDMYGLYHVSGKQHVDNFTNVVHAVPHCTSSELYKGVLDQRARAVFHGRIKVSEGAQKTDAKQSNANLLLSANAEIDTKPQLEIYADDVKCAHGATVGQIDETALFYLRSRGIEEAEARDLLTFAFVNDVLESVAVESLRTVLETELATRLVGDE